MEMTLKPDGRLYPLEKPTHERAVRFLRTSRVSTGDDTCMMSMTIDP